MAAWYGTVRSSSHPQQGHKAQHMYEYCAVARREINEKMRWSFTGRREIVCLPYQSRSIAPDLNDGTHRSAPSNSAQHTHIVVFLLLATVVATDTVLERL